MRNVTLFIAMSLDGYIAGSDGNIDWLQGQEPGGEDMACYEEFVKEVDTVIMGWKTYDQITTQLSPDEWIYKDLTSYVLTHRGIPSTENIIFIEDNVCEVVKRLKQTSGKGIWICGGAGVIHPLIRERLIDKFHINIIPIILGDGIRLFGKMDHEMKLKLIKTQSYNGITDVIYEYRQAD